MSTRIFIDTEFIERPCTIELISLGMVSEHGEGLYLVSSEFDESHANDWVRENVLPHVGDVPRFTRDKIREKVLEFVPEGCSPTFWGYYADYDWVVFCWLFGRMVDLPEHFPKYCMDIKQWAMSLGNPDLPEQDGGEEHNALNDARWNMKAYRYLKRLADSDRWAIREALKGQSIYSDAIRLQILMELAACGQSPDRYNYHCAEEREGADT